MWLTILRSQVATVLVLAIALAAVVGCGDADQPPAPPEPSPSPTVVPPLSPGQVGVSLGIERGWPGSGPIVSEIVLEPGDEFTVVVNADTNGEVMGSGPIVSEIVLEPGDEFTVVVNADTNGEVMTGGQVEFEWDAAALVAVDFLHGDLIGSAPHQGGTSSLGPRA